MPDTRHHVVIVGGGFAGLYAAKALKRAPVRVTLIDRRNHHLFQPLLYQVAMAALSPGEIAQPLRFISAGQRNAEIVLATVTDIDVNTRTISAHAPHDLRSFTYDSLIIAAGATTSYFGNDHWQHFAPSLKTVEDALEIRRRFLLAFESAEYEADPDDRAAALTFVVVGAGPTGVELAGTMAEIGRKVVPRIYRHINAPDIRVVLCEGLDRVLPAMHPDSSARAQKSLEDLGVEVRLNTFVTDIQRERVTLGDSEHIRARNIIWSAGVRANPLVEKIARQTGADTDKAGRARVNPDCSLPAHPEIFIVGDAALMIDPDTNQPVPGVAQGAIQSAQHVAKIIAREARDPSSNAPRPPFRYRDKGTMATIGKARAVAEVFGRRFAGLPAWLLWLFIHILFLIGLRNKLAVLLQWISAYFFNRAGAPLITGPEEGRAGESQ